MTTANLVTVMYVLAVAIGTIPSYYLLAGWKKQSTSQDPFWCSIFPYTVIYTPFMMFIGLIIVICADSIAIALELPYLAHETVSAGRYFGLIALCEVTTWLFMVARPRHFHVLA